MDNSNSYIKNYIDKITQISREELLTSELSYVLLNTYEITDFSILLGGEYLYKKKDNKVYGSYWLRNTVNYIKSEVFDLKKQIHLDDLRNRKYSIRPAIKLKNNFDKSNLKIVDYCGGIPIIEFGRYPQDILDYSKITNYIDKLINTGKTFTTDASKLESFPFFPFYYEEKIIDNNNVVFMENKSDKKYLKDKFYFVEVKPIRWLYDDSNKMLISERLLISNIQYDFLDKNSFLFGGPNTECNIDKFLNKYFIDDISELNNKKITIKKVVEEDKKNDSKMPEKQLYNFDYSKVTKDSMIRGYIEAGIAVYIHGKPGEGKSARIKKLDPDCEIIYLRNATPDSLCGKTIYDSSTGVCVDVCPSWYENIVSRAEKEKDKIHLVFFDELSNALPSIQGMAFNIILDREVNGKWKLPDNVRVVAAGNEMSDSVVANELSEPLYNRFGHVYLETEINEWLRWAVKANDVGEKIDYTENKEEQKIHPAIISYIAFHSQIEDDMLRTEYTGDMPNADPRKWEMASKILYKTNKPEMLEPLVGREVKDDFVKFCKIIDEDREIRNMINQKLEKINIDDLVSFDGVLKEKVKRRRNLK